jgi:triosephosphate isomerase
MRVPMIAANWKMHTTVEEAIELIIKMRYELDRIDGVEKVICPPFISLDALKRRLEGSRVKLGAQDIHYEEKGAFTGEISPQMVADLCDYVIVGHSERRQYFNETIEIVDKKVKAAMKVGLKPILCIGESPEENKLGKTEEVLTKQLSSPSARLYLIGAHLGYRHRPAGHWRAGQQDNRLHPPLYRRGTGQEHRSRRAHPLRRQRYRREYR